MAYLSFFFLMELVDIAITIIFESLEHFLMAMRDYRFAKHTCIQVQAKEENHTVQLSLFNSQLTIKI